MLACPTRCFNAQQVKLAPEGSATLYVYVLRNSLLIIQVGAVWPAAGTQQGTEMQIYLSSPADNTIVAPYTVTLTSPAPYSAAYPWEWQATITPEGVSPPWFPCGLDWL